MADRLALAKDALRRLAEAAAEINRPVQYMEVCGTHTMAAFRTGLHSLLPPNVRLLSGPGCPVCVTAQSDIDLLVELAMDHDITVCSYGDMLRVPGRRGSLEQARGQGADVRVVYSSLDAVRLAERTPRRQVVFAAVGFETTAPATAAAVLEAERRKLDNFSCLTSHKRILPAMLALLEAGDVELDGFLCPGHVSVILGADAYRPIVQRFLLPCVVGGFEDLLMADAVAQLAELTRDGRAALVNQYPQVVSAHGNRVARQLLDHAFEISSARWRGLGEIPDSGLILRSAYASFDAARRFVLRPSDDAEPVGCRCGEVIRGLIKPCDCPLFASGCTPVHPIGPCMVSSEGTCQAWFKYARGHARSGESERTARLGPSIAPAPMGGGR